MVARVSVGAHTKFGVHVCWNGGNVARAPVPVFEIAEERLPIYPGMTSEQQHDLIRAMWSRGFVLDKLSFQFQYGTGAMDAFGGDWSSFWREQLNMANGTYAEIWIRLTLSVLPIAILVMWMIVSFAAMVISISWRDHPENKHVTRVKHVLFSPMMWKSLLRNRLNLRLNSNPISWLHEYSWKARVSKWGGCLAAMLICTHFLNQVHYGNQGLLSALRLLMWITLISVAFSAVASFRTEKDSGGMELLLITPIGTHNIILGQVYGVWKRYLPTIAILTIVWCAVYLDLPGRFSHFSSEMHWWEPLLLLSSSYTLAMIGTQFSFNNHSLLTSWALTLLYGLVAPLLFLLFLVFIVMFFVMFFGIRLHPEILSPVALFVLFTIQLLMVARSMNAADRLLNKRIFFLGKNNAEQSRKYGVKY